MKKTALISLSLLALAGCGGTSQSSNRSVTETAEVHFSDNPEVNRQLNVLSSYFGAEPHVRREDLNNAKAWYRHPSRDGYYFEEEKQMSFNRLGAREIQWLGINTDQPCWLNTFTLRRQQVIEATVLLKRDITDKMVTHQGPALVINHINKDNMITHQDGREIPYWLEVKLEYIHEDVLNARRYLDYVYVKDTGPIDVRVAGDTWDYNRSNVLFCKDKMIRVVDKTQQYGIRDGVVKSLVIEDAPQFESAVVRAIMTHKEDNNKMWKVFCWETVRRFVEDMENGNGGALSEFVEEYTETTTTSGFNASLFNMNFRKMGAVAFGVAQGRNDTTANTTAVGFKTTFGGVAFYGNVAMTQAPLVTKAFRYETGVARHMAVGRGMLQGYVGLGVSKGRTLKHKHYAVKGVHLHTELRGEHTNWHMAAGLEFAKRNWSLAAQVQVLPRTWNDAHYTFNSLTSYETSNTRFGGVFARLDVKRQFGFGELKMSASNKEAAFSLNMSF